MMTTSPVFCHRHPFIFMLCGTNCSQRIKKYLLQRDTHFLQRETHSPQREIHLPQREYCRPRPGRPSTLDPAPPSRLLVERENLQNQPLSLIVATQLALVRVAQLYNPIGSDTLPRLRESC